MLSIVASAALAVAASATTNDQPEPDAPGIPPGQEELLWDMLGKDAKLPGGCKVGDVGVVYTVVEAKYSCDLGEVVIELTHSTEAYDEDTQTRDFALAVLEGSAPESLIDVLSSRIHEREDEFEWLMPSGDEAAEQAFDED